MTEEILGVGPEDGVAPEDGCRRLPQVLEGEAGMVGQGKTTAPDAEPERGDGGFGQGDRSGYGVLVDGGIGPGGMGP